MIEIKSVTKKYGDYTAIDRSSGRRHIVDALIVGCHADPNLKKSLILLTGYAFGGAGSQECQYEKL